MTMTSVGPFHCCCSSSFMFLIILRHPPVPTVVVSDQSTQDVAVLLHQSTLVRVENIVQPEL